MLLSAYRPGFPGYRSRASSGSLRFVHIKTSLLATSLAAVALLSACGGSDDGDANGNGDANGGGGAAKVDCIDSFNKASRDIRAQASLSHRGEGADIQVGTYTGAPFKETGEFYDSSGSSSTAEVSVMRGDCVAVDLTGGDSETNWVAVSVKGGGGTQPGWYFLDETGKHPLAKVPQPVGEPVRARIVGFGVEAKLQPGN